MNAGYLHAEGTFKFESTEYLGKIVVHWNTIND
jgi:hypothetical protein